MLHVVEVLFDAVVPLRCASCGAHGSEICEDCMTDFAAMRPLVRSARNHMPGLVALGSYKGSLRAAVLNMKFRGRRRAAAVLGRLLGSKLGRVFAVIVPVPLHARRLRERGFNQSALLAQSIASTVGAALAPDALVRDRVTLRQSSLPLSERQSNIRDAFAAGPDIGEVKGRDVLLVDDVVTTGATVAACTQVLRSSGAREVGVAALAIKL